ncbi:hypothetical protein ACFY1P_21770 [Streptomyces sp. NPDC001407]|uniref:hypothetical protein n=1 Tax=unclassified Streptomyces TaxID=2593676 RepID=UPI0036AD50A9
MSENKPVTMPELVAVSDVIRAAVPSRILAKAAAAYGFTPIHRCVECGKTIDLRIDATSLQAAVMVDAAGDPDRPSHITMLCHELCAPPQLISLTDKGLDELNERWWGTKVGRAFAMTEVVSSGGRTWPLMVIEMANTDVVVDEANDGTRTARSGVFGAMANEGFAVLGAHTELAALPVVPGWEMLLGKDGYFSAIVCPEDSEAGGSGVFMSAGDPGWAVAPEWVQAANDVGQAILVTTLPGTFGLPRQVDWDEDMRAAITSTLLSVARQVSSKPEDGPTGQPVFLRAVADGLVVGARIPVRLT